MQQMEGLDQDSLRGMYSDAIVDALENLITVMHAKDGEQYREPEDMESEETSEMEDLDAPAESAEVPVAPAVVDDEDGDLQSEVRDFMSDAPPPPDEGTANLYGGVMPKPNRKPMAKKVAKKATKKARRK